MLTRWGFGAPSVWSEMSRLSREMDRLFGEGRAASRSGVFPPLNVYDDGESLVVKTEIPGVDPAHLELEATLNTLTIRGERERHSAGENASYHRRERGHGTFRRTISLPQEVDPNKVQASYKLGILEVILPKAEAARPRKIDVQS